MKKPKKREFQASQLVKSFAKIHGFENKLLAFEVKDFLRNYLDQDLFNEIETVNIQERVLIIRIKSPLFRNDFRLRKSFFLAKFQEKFGDAVIHDLQIL